MTTLTHAHRELYRRTPDEMFASLPALYERCVRDRERSQDRWRLPQDLQPGAAGSTLALSVGDDGAFALNDWSFTQLCRLAGVSRDTVNRLSPETASLALRETLPRGSKPLQILTGEASIRSIHGTQYSRLWNQDLVYLLKEFATDFQPPQEAAGGGTGLYCGEQDLFAFLIDPAGWTEIGGEAFAPGFFVWNSEVGKRSVGISTFWFQAVCQNHIVWDAADVCELTRKHTASVHEILGDIRGAIERLVALRDKRKDGFVRIIRKAMETVLGDDAEAVMKSLAHTGVTRPMIKEAMEIARQKGRFTIWALVDALTRLSTQVEYAGDRMEADQRAAALLALAA